jgi:hypothetical protein
MGGCDLAALQIIRSHLPSVSSTFSHFNTPMSYSHTAGVSRWQPATNGLKLGL